MNNILIVDDDARIRVALSKFLQEKQFRTDVASSGASAIKMALTNDYDVVILDQMMPEMSGADVLLELKKFTPQSKVIMMTGFGSIHDAIEAIKKGATEYIQKPFDFEELSSLIKRCAEEKKFSQCLEKLDLDFTLSTLSNPIRRRILKLIQMHDGIHLMKIASKLDIDDHTKVVFHLKNLMNTGLIKKDAQKGYHMTKEGMKAFDCLDILGRHLSD
jgi:DNA-binding NtrC family response regulator